MSAENLARGLRLHALLAAYHNPSAGHDPGCACCRLPDGHRFYVERDGLYLALGPGFGAHYWGSLEFAHGWRSEGKELAEQRAKAHGGTVVALPEGGA